MAGIKRFRIHQRADYSLHVLVVPEPGKTAPAKSEIGRAMTSAIGAGAAIDVKFVSEIPVDSSGKFRYVTSDAGPRPDDVRSEAAPCAP